MIKLLYILLKLKVFRDWRVEGHFVLIWYYESHCRYIFQTIKQRSKVVMNDKMFSFEGILSFCKSFYGIVLCALWNPCFIAESGSWYFAKFDFNFFEILKFWVLFSTIPRIVRAKQNEMFPLQWFGWLDVKGRHLFMSGFIVKVHPNIVFVSLYQNS